MKQQYLLDTCICAYWLRDKQNVRERINAVGFDNCCISEMTVAELIFFEAIKVLPVAPSSTSTPRRRLGWHWLARPQATSTCSLVVPPLLKAWSW